MKGYYEYLSCLLELVTAVRDTQGPAIEEAADLIAEAIGKGHMVHFWGPGGHSSLFAEDVLYREGELALINPILDPDISLANGALKEINYYERIPEIGRAVMRSNDIKPGDIMVIGSAYGVNPVCIEGAMESKRMGATLVTITSPYFSDALDNDNTKHSNGKSLYELADININSQVPYDDLTLEMEGFPQKYGPVGTILQLLTLKALTTTVITKLIKAGGEVPVWRNALEQGGPEFNERYMNQIWPVAKAL